MIRHPSFVDIDHAIFSMVVLSLYLIQEMQLSVTDERNVQWILVTRLVGLNMPRKDVARLTYILSSL